MAVGYHKTRAYVARGPVIRRLKLTKAQGPNHPSANVAKGP